MEISLFVLCLPIFRCLPVCCYRLVHEPNVCAVCKLSGIEVEAVSDSRYSSLLALRKFVGGAVCQKLYSLGEPTAAIVVFTTHGFEYGPNVDSIYYTNVSSTETSEKLKTAFGNPD